MSGSSSPPVYPASLIDTYTIAFEGSSVACILFGVFLTISAINLSILRKKRYSLLLVYTIFQVVFTTVYMVVSLYAAPAQSLALFSIGNSYSVNALSPAPMVAVDIAFVLNTLSSDAFLLYRCHVIWAGKKVILVLPALLFLATFASSMAWLVVSSHPGAVYTTHDVQVTGISYFTCSATMNVCASILIAVRLWMYRRANVRAVGSHVLGAHYLSYTAMTLEAALLYTLFALITLAVFTANSPLENLFFPMLGTIQVVAPSLIIYRIAHGIAFDGGNVGRATSGYSRTFPDTLVNSVVRPSLEGKGSRSQVAGEKESV